MKDLITYNTLDWVNSSQGVFALLVTTISLTILFYVKWKFNGKYLDGLTLKVCSEDGIDIPMGVLLFFVFPPFAGFILVAMLIIIPILTLGFIGFLILLFYMWEYIGK